MRRRIANALRIASFLLWLAAAALWARSVWTTDVVKFGSARLYKAASGNGGVMLESLVMLKRVGDWRTGLAPGGAGLSQYTETQRHYLESRRAAAGERATRWELKQYPSTDQRTFDLRAWAHVDHPLWPQAVPVNFKAGATYDNVTGQADETWFVGRAVWIPYWLMMALTGMAPAVWIANTGVRRARERRRLNLCVRCGYDLRATPGRCPECGTVAAGGGP